MKRVAGMILQADDDQITDLKEFLDEKDIRIIYFVTSWNKLWIKEGNEH